MNAICVLRIFILCKLRAFLCEKRATLLRMEPIWGILTMTCNWRKWQRTITNVNYLLSKYFSVNETSWCLQNTTEVVFSIATSDWLCSNILKQTLSVNWSSTPTYMKFILSVYSRLQVPTCAGHVRQHNSTIGTLVRHNEGAHAFRHAVTTSFNVSLVHA